MAKAVTIKVKLVSTADTGFYYVAKKNSRTMTDKLVKKKYDTVARKHVEFKESKISNVATHSRCHPMLTDLNGACGPVLTLLRAQHRPEPAIGPAKAGPVGPTRVDETAPPHRNLTVRSRALARRLEPSAARPSFETRAPERAPQDEASRRALKRARSSRDNGEAVARG